MTESTLKQRLRFGDFELDPAAYELRHRGKPVRLERQPMDVLILLVKRRGQLVSREDIVERLWGPGVFVDVETGVNTAIRKLRIAFGDSAEGPQFIETVPRRGYRFVAAVEESSNGIPMRELVGGVSPQNGDLSGSGNSDLVREVKRAPATKRAPAIIASSAAALLLVAGVIYWRSLPRLSKVTNVVQVTNDAKGKIPWNLFVTDGVQLYFLEGAPWAGGSRIAQVSAVGGETTEIETSLRDVYAILDISPDFSELLVARGMTAGDDHLGRSEVWAQPLPAGTPHRVGNIHAVTACFTPDGRHILYADGSSLVMINLDGSNPHEVAKVQGTVHGLRFSPDGKRVRFFVAPANEFWMENGSVWEIDANGNNPRPLLPNWKESPFQYCGNWSPDGSYYFFQGSRGNDQAIWVMPEHRSLLGGAHGSPFRLISGPLRLSAPVPSIDGKKLFVMGENLRVEPVRYDAKTHRFETYLDGISAAQFEFSRDHKWVAYVSYPDMNLWRSRTDGSEKMQLTFPPVRAYGPRWSPDGSRIAFMNTQLYRPWTISIVSSSGGAPQSLPSSSPNESESNPNWLPDGNAIIFDRTKRDDSNGRAIFRLDFDSGKISVIPNSDGLFSPQLSPDGRYIAVFSQAMSELLLFDSKTNHWSSLAKGGHFSYNLWSQDGRYVYMRETRGGSPWIVRVRIRDARMEDVVSLKDVPQLVDVYAGWFGLTADGDPVVSRDRSVQEIYALDLR